MKDCD